MRRPGNHRWISLLACAVLLAPVRAQAPSHPSPEMYGQPKPVESFQLSVEWRLVRAGTATLTRTPQPGGSWQADLHLESTGLVSKLYRVNDDYRTFYDSGFCADTTYMKAEEEAGGAKPPSSITATPGNSTTSSAIWSRTPSPCKRNSTYPIACMIS